MEENTGNTENKKKTKIMVIGHVDHGKTTLTAALMQALKIKEVKEEDIIIVDINELPTVSAKMKESEDPFDNTPKFVIKNYNLEPMPELKAIDMTEHNPWPSPKGRKGKRRW